MSVLHFTLLITVYYESLCPDSRAFVVDQMLPVMEKLSPYLRTELIPYGKATTQLTLDGYKFKCQHGSTECLGNKYHACAIKYIPDDLTKVRVVACMIDNNRDPENIARKCTEKYKVNWELVQSCANGDEGITELKMYGDKTHSLIPRLSFVPTVLINEDMGNQTEMLRNLLKEVCNRFKVSPISLPSECKRV